MFGNDAAKATLKYFLQDIEAQGFDEFMQWTEPNGCGATLDLILLQEEVSEFMNTSCTLDKDYVESVLIRCEALKQQFNTAVPMNAGTLGEMKVERSVANAESLSYLHRTLRKLHFLQQNKFRNVPHIQDELYQDVLTL